MRVYNINAEMQDEWCDGRYTVEVDTELAGILNKIRMNQRSGKLIPLSEVYRIIAGHSDYHGNSILSALTCVAEGKHVDPVATYEPVNDALTDENKRLKAELKKIEEKCAKLDKENDKLDKENDKLREVNKWLANECNDFIERHYECHEVNKWLANECNDFIERHSELAKENEKLREVNSWLANECNDFIERHSELAKENDKLRTMNSDLLYRNGQLMQKSDPVIFQHAYGELSDKIEGLKEDIIRLDKCLSKRQCVQLERIKED